LLFFLPLADPFISSWLSQAHAIMLGLVIGDALGTTSEGFAPFAFDGQKRVEATVHELLVTRGRIPNVSGNDPDKREWPKDREWPRDLVGGANRVTHTRPWAPGEVSDDTQTALAILRACVKLRRIDKDAPARLTLLLDEFQHWAAWSPDVGYTMFKVFAWYRARTIAVDADLVQADTNATTHEVFWASESNGALMRNGGMVAATLAIQEDAHVVSMLVGHTVLTHHNRLVVLVQRRARFAGAALVATGGNKKTRTRCPCRLPRWCRRGCTKCACRCGSSGAQMTHVEPRMWCVVRDSYRVG
jgi:hypothetical protein